MKVLFIGGTGIISSACTQLAVDKGIDLYHLNRGQSSRPTPEGVTVLRGDIRDPESVRQALADHTFDAVVDWIAFTPDHIETDIALFAGRTKQFVFISSASAYHTPPLNLPITESCPLHNPFWQYSRNKIACEERLMKAYREERLPHHHRAPVPHLRPHPDAHGLRLHDHRPHAPGQEGDRAWGRHQSVDLDPSQGLCRGLRGAAGQPSRHWGQLSTSPTTRC